MEMKAAPGCEENQRKFTFGSAPARRSFGIVAQRLSFRSASGFAQCTVQRAPPKVPKRCQATALPQVGGTSLVFPSRRQRRPQAVSSTVDSRSNRPATKSTACPKAARPWHVQHRSRPMNVFSGARSPANRRWSVHSRASSCCDPRPGRAWRRPPTGQGPSRR